MSAEESTPLDELLAADDHGSGPVDPVARPANWVTLLLSSAALAGAGWAVLRMFGYLTPFPLLWAVAATLVLIRRARRRLGPRPVPAVFTGRAVRIVAYTVRGHRYPTGAAPPERAGRWARWDTQLSWAEKDAASFTRIVLPRLAVIADERLRLHHAVTRDGDPSRARALLGERLWTLLHEPLKRPPNARELADVITTLEQL